MKYKHFLFVISISGISILGQCRKSDKNIEDPHNHSLSNKSLAEIRKEIKGNWYIMKSTVCGFTGCQTIYNNINSADILSFLANDTLKQTGHDGTPIYFYEKADSVKSSMSFYTNPPQPSWTFFFSLEALTFTRVQNDTLIAETGHGEIGLIKTP